jgi:hypothetical protein
MTHGRSNGTADDVALDNLLRQRLVKPVERQISLASDPGAYLIDSRDDIVVTALGAAFVRACRR